MLFLKTESYSYKYIYCFPTPSPSNLRHSSHRVSVILYPIHVVQVSEFSKSVDLSHLNVLSDEVLIIWKWSWVTGNDGEHGESKGASPECADSDNERPSSSPTSDVEADRSQRFEHSVTFKVIGCCKERRYQETLRTARDMLDEGLVVPVELSPEPTNPVSSRAIAFRCKINGKPVIIGYVVSEILNEVHHAIENSEIVGVRFSWIKYISDWTRSGPGFFAGVVVTKRGYWSSSVVRAASTR